MGWYLFRGKAVAAALGLLASVAAGAQESSPLGQGVFFQPPSPIPISLFEPARIFPAAPGSALPPLQGHRGEELYSLSIPAEAAVQGFQRAYLERNRDWIAKMLDRLPTYRNVITARIQSLGLPRELLFLPAVESGYNAKATSPHGAAGLWQLMAATSASYGLATDWWLDERRDFMKSTEASLTMLSSYNRYFEDWHLALAAYNCGISALTRLLRDNNVRDYWTLRSMGKLPAETASFVPQFLAVAEILSYPGRYGFPVRWDPDVAWTRIPVERSVDLRILSKEANVPYEILHAANGELNADLTPPAAYRYSLKVPMEYREAVVEALSSDSLPMIDFVVYVIKPGDTFFGLARSFGVTVELLSQYNPDARPKALRIGSRIFVPRISKG